MDPVESTSLEEAVNNLGVLVMETRQQAQADALQGIRAMAEAAAPESGFSLVLPS